MQEGGRKSFRREELEPQYYLNKKSGFLVPFLDGVQTDLNEREKERGRAEIYFISGAVSASKSF